jgi:acetylornithine deacetylase/succinyl-diaminopimelate desuccinylase-like protein
VKKKEPKSMSTTAETFTDPVSIGPMPTEGYNGASTMRHPQILDHLRELVGYYPVTENPDSVLSALKYCQTRLERTGSFQDAEIIPVDGAAWGPTYNLYASTQGTKQPKVLLQAHIDVVPTDVPEQRKLTVEGDTATGRSVLDMSFATASYLKLLLDLADSGKLADLDIGVMLTGDEEKAGFYGVNALLNRGYGADVCILPDGGGQWGDLDVASKGFYLLDVTVKGKGHHGSLIGDGALNKMFGMVHDLQERTGLSMTDPDASTINITWSDAGNAHPRTINATPDSATFGLDIRPVNPAALRRVEEAMDELCHEYDATIGEVRKHHGFQLDLDNPLVHSFVDMYEQHYGGPINRVRSKGSSDARFFGDHNIPTLIFRPDGAGAHGSAETLSLPSLDRFHDLLGEYVVQAAQIAA